jgi:signal transduction histidine kinase
MIDADRAVSFDNNAMSSQPLTNADHSSRPRRVRQLATQSRSKHHVQFYESEKFLIATACDHLALGLTAGQRCIVIATQAHRAAFAKELSLRGHDVSGARDSRQLELLDARKMLAQFISNGSVDASRFHAVVAPLFERPATPTPRSPVRAYGEMVNLLCEDGNPEAAIALEALWNELSAVRNIELLCAYAMSNFESSAQAAQFEAVCGHHSHVEPTERYSRLDKSVRLLEVTRLQQRARALENEIARRETLEQQLRESLEEQERSLMSERAARAEAEQASRAKNQFLAVMSHELRTPLNAIAGHTQLLELELHGPLTLAQRKALDRIGHSQRHLLGLVNDVLNLSRVESGHAEYLCEDVEIIPVVEALVAMVEPLMTAAQLHCTFDVSPTAASLVVRADKEKVQQILLNLLTNAMKFTPPGGSITIGATRSTNSDAVWIDVRDTGIGIPAERVDAVFEPFVQLAEKLSSRLGGLGLGLTISREFARGMGGDLAVISTTPEGATFRLTLPGAQLR